MATTLSLPATGTSISCKVILYNSTKEFFVAKKPFNPVIPDYTQKREKEKEVHLDFQPCCECGKAIEEGYYARYGNGGVCSKTCMQAKEKKPRYPAPSPEFLQQLEIQDDLTDGFQTDPSV